MAPSLSRFINPLFDFIFWMTTMHHLIFVLSLFPVLALAHEGHGIDGASHYHATDVWGFVIALAIGAVMWWMGRNK